MGQISKSRARWEGLRVKAFGDITGSFTILGDPLDNEARGIVIWNNTDAELSFTWNTDIGEQIRLGPGGSYSPDLSTNHSPQQDLTVPKEDQLFVQHLGSAPTQGSAQLIVMHAN